MEMLAARIRSGLCIQRIDGAFEPDNNKGKCYTLTTRGRHMLHIKHSNVQAKHDSDLAAASLRFTLICSEHNQFTPPYT